MLGCFINKLSGPENRHEQIGIMSVSRDLRFVFCFNIHDFAGLRNAVISFIDRVRHESSIRLIKPADLQ